MAVAVAKPAGLALAVARAARLDLAVARPAWLVRLPASQLSKFAIFAQICKCIWCIIHNAAWRLRYYVWLWAARPLPAVGCSCDEGRRYTSLGLQSAEDDAQLRTFKSAGDVLYSVSMCMLQAWLSGMLLVLLCVRQACSPHAHVAVK